MYLAKERKNKVLCKLLLIALVFVVLAPVTALADNASDEARIQRLEAAVKSLQSELQSLKAERARRPLTTADQKRVEKMVNKMIQENKADLGVVPEWVKNMKWFGDFRYRHEGFDDTGQDATKRNRNRIRFRLGLKAKVNDDWDVIFRLASGSSETPTSTNQTIGDSSGSSTSSGEAFSSKDLWLDLAYGVWHPDSIEGFKLLMGKMKNPFFRAGKNQVIWDSDVNPEGIAAQYNWAVSDAATAYLNAGGFWIEERSTDGDAGLFGLQTYLKHKFYDDTKLIVGAGLYCFTNIEGFTPPDSISSAGSGNTLTGGLYEYDYDLVEAFSEYSFKCHGLPVALFATYVQNKASVNNRDTAYFLGFKLNKIKKTGDWQFTYDYRDVETDATLGGLTDSDFIDGGTDGAGHKLAFAYQLDKNLKAGLTYFCTERFNSSDVAHNTDRFRRWQIDMVYKFK